MNKKFSKLIVLLISCYLLWQFVFRPSLPPDHIDADKSPPSTDQSPGPETGVQFHSQHPPDFNQAKQILRKLYPTGKEFYCGCNYDLTQRDRIDESSCGYKGIGPRSKRIEWEHVVPASVFGRKFSAWSRGDPDCIKNGHHEKGRSCARKESPEFRQMEADLYNLLPALGELNAARSNFDFGEIAGEPRIFGACDFEVVNKRVEPRPEIRGDIARIYFYMDARYPGFEIVNKSNEGLLSSWDKLDPIDDEERQRIKDIEAEQGNSFFIGRLQKMAQRG